MDLIAAGILVLTLGVSASFADDKPDTKPAAQYAALLKKYQPASRALRLARTDRQRKTAVERLGTFPRQFLDLAEEYPKHPIALQALREAIQADVSTDSAAQISWELNRGDFPAGRKDASAGRTVKLLRRDHVRSDQLEPVIDRLRYGYRLEYETILSTLAKSSPHRRIRALAGLALARFLNDRLRLLRLVDNRPELIERHAILFGREYLPRLRRMEKAGLAGRIETLLEGASKFGDLKVRFRGTVGKQAESELYEFRHLSVGKPAPEIAGKDQDGKSFKLSDYRGKVVLLYFWTEF